MNINSTRLLEILRPLHRTMIMMDGGSQTYMNFERQTRTSALKSWHKTGKRKFRLHKNMLNDKSFNTCDVLLWWGNNIDRHDYLREYATDLLNYLDEINMNYLCIGLTAKENPFHPAPMGVNRFLVVLTISNYNLTKRKYNYLEWFKLCNKF